MHLHRMDGKKWIEQNRERERERGENAYTKDPVDEGVPFLTGLFTLFLHACPFLLSRLWSVCVHAYLRHVACILLGSAVYAACVLVFVVSAFPLLSTPWMDSVYKPILKTKFDLNLCLKSHCFFLFLWYRHACTESKLNWEEQKKW